MNIYLCSRIAKDAHEINNKVAAALRALGHTVFVPHEQHYNEIMAGTAEYVSDEDIYRQDMDAMEQADLCVAVGRLGVDCAFEVGWFQGSNIPVYWYKPNGIDYGRHPMLFDVAARGALEGPFSIIEAVIDRNARKIAKQFYNKG